MIKKRLLGFSLAMVMACSVLGCGNSASTGGKNGAIGGEDVVLWYESATAKIVLNDDGKAAEEAAGNQVLKVSMSRNEEEGVQMMMYAKQEIPSYTVNVSDLVCGEAKISSEDIAIYQLKYQTIDDSTGVTYPEYYNEMLPDPMLPFETAVEYKENSVEKGNNQAIYFDITTTKDTASGIYTGEVTVETEVGTYTMPMEVTVHDITIPDTSELKTYAPYFKRDAFNSAELDGSDEMATKYMEVLLDYNMSSIVPATDNIMDLEKYLENLRVYYNTPGFNFYRIEYDTTAGYYDGEAVECNFELFKEYVKAIAEMSVEDKVDYLENACYYPWDHVDEPQNKAQFLAAKKSLDTYLKVLADADKELREKYAGTEEYPYYEAVISKSLTNLPYMLTVATPQSTLVEYGLEKATICTPNNMFNTESELNELTAGREDMQIWTYLCCVPFYPYANYAFDSPVVGLRTLGWMCNDYEIDMLMAWKTVNYMSGPDGEVVEDRWTTSTAGETGITPGDGNLFYPGAKYGIDGPCPSLRAMAFRDAVDDYSLIEEFKEVYYEYGLDPSSILQTLYDKIYTGTIPTTDDAIFNDVRNELFAMIADLKESTAILYREQSVFLSKGTVEFVCLEEDAKVTYDGKKLTPDEEGFYTIKLDLTKEKACTFKVESGKNKKEYTCTLVDGELKIEGFEDVTGLEDYMIAMTGDTLEISGDYALEGSAAVKATLNQAGAAVTPYVAFMKDSELIGGSWSGIKLISFYVYNPTEQVLKATTSYFDTQVRTVGTVELTPGEWTKVDVPMLGEISDVETIKELDLIFEQGTAATVYIDGFSIQGE